LPDPDRAIEQKLKAIIGDLIFQIAALQVELERAKAQDTTPRERERGGE